MERVCLIGDSAPLYRLAVYKAMFAEFNCDFVLAHSSNTKQFRDNELGNIHWVKHRSILGSRVYYQTTSIKYSFSYDVLILDCGLFCISEWIILLFALFRKKRTYLWTHGWYGRETIIKKIIKKVNYSLATGIFLYGNYAKDLMVKEGYDPLKLFVIHNSLNYDVQLQLRNNLIKSDLYKSRFNNTNPVIIFIGRLTAVKRLDILLQSLKLLKDDRFMCNLVLVGDGVMKEAISSLIDELELNDQVWLYGECYDEETNAHLVYNADVCVSPGNVGLTAMHSMMFGTPVISHDDFTRQMPEFESIKEGKTGCFFQSGNPLSLANTIKQWLVSSDREQTRLNCFKEIDTRWTPSFEISVMKSAIYQ